MYHKEDAFPLKKFKKTCLACKRLQSQMITNMVALHVTNYVGKIIGYRIISYWKFNNQTVTPTNVP